MSTGPPPTEDAITRAAAALLPFAEYWALPVTPEDLDEMAWAVLSHLDPNEAPAEIHAAVRAQIDEYADKQIAMHDAWNESAKGKPEGGVQPDLDGAGDTIDASIELPGSGWFFVAIAPAGVAFFTSYAAIPEHAPTDSTWTAVTLALVLLSLVSCALGIKGFLKARRRGKIARDYFAQLWFGAMSVLIGVTAVGILNEGQAI